MLNDFPKAQTGKWQKWGEKLASSSVSEAGFLSTADSLLTVLSFGVLNSHRQNITFVCQDVGVNEG